jgi:hypothetical protein
MWKIVLNEGATWDSSIPELKIARRNAKQDMVAAPKGDCLVREHSTVRV